MRINNNPSQTHEATTIALRIWDMRIFQCKTAFKNVNCCHSSGLCQIDRDRVIVGKQRGFYIVNVKKCEIEKEVHDGQMGYVYCFLPLWENMVVMGNGKGGFAFMMLTIINFLY